MSTFIGKVGSTPICHMTSDTQTQTTLEGDPISTTLFHSQLPYVFAREQFELTSYTNWGDTNGGRTFAFSQALIDFKDNNPELACLVILEDSSGNATVFQPTLSGWYFKIGRNTPRYGAVATLGHQYSCAFTSSDTQLTNITNQTYDGSNLGFTFNTFDTNDTRITVFKHSILGGHTCNAQFSSIQFDYCDFDGEDTSYGCRGDVIGYGTGDLDSSAGNDITKVRFVFLNIENTATTFNRQKDYSGTSSITIKDDQFNVGNIDLIKNAPIVCHGVLDTTDSASPVFGSLAAGVPADTYSYTSNYRIGKVDKTGGSPDRNNCPILEFPDPSDSNTTMEYDFSTKVFKRDGQPVFSASSAAKGLQVLGTAELSFNVNAVNMGELTSNTATLATDTTSFSGTSANTLYLASLVYSGDGTNWQELPTCLFSVGDNYLFRTIYEHSFVITNVAFYRIGVGVAFICNIDSNGDITIKRYQKSCNFTNFSSAGGYGLGQMKLRLIAMDS
jgi:hypothetical protein